MRPIETIDVSLPRASTGTEKAAVAAWDLALILFPHADTAAGTDGPARR